MIITLNKQNSLKILLTFFLILIRFICLKSQVNLVPNPSFEQYNICPIGGLFNPINNGPADWYSVDKGYSSYFNACATIGYGNVPYTYYGYQNSHSGVAICLQGFWYLTTSNTNVSSYIQTKLIDSLDSGKKYYIEFYVVSAKFAKHYCNNIGLLLTANKVYADTITPPVSSIILGSNVITNYNNPVITDTNNWVKISSIYTAKGGEQYVTLGNFKYRNQSTVIKKNNSNIYYDGAGYFIDDVSVIPLDSICLKADAGRDTTIQQGDSVFIGSYTNGIDTIKWLANGTTIIDSTRPGFWVKPSATSIYVLQQTVNGCFSSDTVYINVALPLKFINYNVISKKEKSVENVWATANEVNVSHFNIQRSINGKYFYTLQKVAAKNNSYNEYSFVDMQPLFGDSYYRIESVDRDGKKSYSEVKKVSILNYQLSINIYPNPAKDVLNILSKENIKEIKITNQLGQTLQQLNNLNTKHQVINTRQFSKGVYIIQVTTNKNEIKNQKIIIK
jgi:hypothetical protein